MVRGQRSLATPDHFRADVAVALPDEKLLMVDDQVEVLRREVPRVQELEGAGLFVQPGLQLGVVAELDVELEPAHAGEVVLARIEEHAIEERRGGVGGGRVSRPHLPIQFDQRLLGRFEVVAGECLADDRAHVVALREEEAQLGDAGILDRTERARGERVVGFQEHFAGRGVHDVDRGKGALNVVRGDFHLRDMRLLHLLQDRGGDFPSRLQDRFMRAGVLDLLRDFPSLESLGDLPVQFAVLDRDLFRAVESLHDLGVVLQTEGAQKDGGEKLPLPVDANIKDVLRIVLKLDPRASVRDDLAEEIGLLRV